MASTSPLSCAQVEDIQALLIGARGKGHVVQGEDLQRWLCQGFVFDDEEVIYGLTQNQGGPCGVISA